MKSGQLVMLVKRDLAQYGLSLALRMELGGFPPLGCCGEVVKTCPDSIVVNATHVLFPNYPDNSFPAQGRWWCIQTSWLMPIDDPDAVKAADDQLGMDFSDRTSTYAKQRLDEQMEKLRKTLRENFDVEKA